MSPVPAAAVLASLAAVALISDRAWVVAAIAAALLALCLKAPRSRRWLYLAGTLVSALTVFLLSPLVAHVRNRRPVGRPEDPRRSATST